jgi:ATP-dependent helicase/DNAse subunit B
MLLSPTAINKYIDCPLRFYYNYAAKLYDNNDGDEDIVDSRIFGLIFHRAAQLVYEKLLPQGIIHAEDIEKILNDRTKPLDSIIAQAFSEELFNLPKGTVHHPQLNGMQLITREAVMTYLRRLLSIDKRIAPFRVIGHELDTRQTIFLDDNTSVDIGGRIDRLDEVGIGTPDHRLRVVDYKTGSSVVDNIGDVKQLFEPPTNKIHTHGYALQTMLYADSVSRDIKLRQDYPIIAQIERDGPLPVQPTLLFILKAGNRDYQPDLLLNKESVTDIRRQVSDELHEHLAELLHDIFNISQPFRPTDDINRCKYCPFTRLCGR